MGKVKGIYNEKTDYFTGNASIPYGKGKVDSDNGLTSVMDVSIPYGKGKAEDEIKRRIESVGINSLWERLRSCPNL